MTAVLNQTTPIVYDRRQVEGERPDRDGKYDFPFRAVCVPKPNRSPIECQLQEVFTNEAAAHHCIETHACPTIYDPPRRYGVLSIAEKLWIELDHTVDALMLMTAGGVPANDPDRLILKGQATGLAKAIVMMCQPYYADETAVSKQSLARYKQRNGEAEWEPTPGFKYDPPIPTSLGRDSSTRIDAKAPTYGRNDLDNLKNKLGTAKVGQIQQGINSGMFQPKDFAKVFGITEAQVEAIAKS